MEQIGIDEAGVGTLAGPMAMAVVALPEDAILPKVTDSKKMTDASREEAIDHIYATALYRYIEYGSVLDIDTYGVWGTWEIHVARLMSAVFYSFPACKILIDGSRRPARGYATPVVGGDRIHLCISAASVLAKYGQCLHMDELHRSYPEYGFDQHRGYSSPDHMKAIKKFGAVPGVHRKKYVETMAKNQKFDLKWRKL